MKNIFITFLYVLAILMVSCEKETPLWSGDTYARLEGPEEWTLSTDSLLFSFAAYMPDVTEYTFTAKIYIIGEVADRDRTVGLSIDNTKTTANSEQYTFPSTVTIPSGEHYAEFPVTLIRTSDLTQKSVRLCIALDGSQQIGRGVEEWNSLTLVWNDIISKPTNWDNLTEFFGTYSDVKYRFIISTLGIGVFTYGETDGMTWGDMNNYKIILVNALNEYNAAHPGNPLTDENNQLVSF